MVAGARHNREMLSLLAAIVRVPPSGSVGLLDRVPPDCADRLITLAREHGVEAWLAGTAPLDDPRWHELAEQRNRFLASQVRTLATVRDVGALLRPAGLDWLVLKGPALAYGVYPRPDLRHYVDLDLLVTPGAFAEVLSILETADFTMVDRNWRVIEREYPGELRVRSPRGVLIDLHWALFQAPDIRGAFDLTAESVLAHSRDLEPPGLPTLDEVDQLVYVGLHAALSGANRLGWLLDAHLAAGTLSDWDQFHRAAAHAGAGPALALVLARSQRLLGTGLPRGTVQALAGGRTWPMITTGLDRISPLGASPIRPSISRSLARSIRSTPAKSLCELAKHAATWVRAGARRRYVRPSWRDPDDLGSSLRDVPDSGARGRYLAKVSKEGLA